MNVSHRANIPILMEWLIVQFLPFTNSSSPLLIYQHLPDITCITYGYIYKDIFGMAAGDNHINHETFHVEYNLHKDFFLL